MEPAAGHFLILFPKDPLWAPADLASIAQVLQQVGLVGEQRDSGLYSTGPDYLSLITYLGCSPQISLGENEEATTIRLSGIFEVPRFVHGANLKLPRCPKCRKSLERYAPTSEPEEPMLCGHCGHTRKLHEFDWRRSAAFGRVFIEISNVFESEAVPGEELTDCLRQATGKSWDYAYLRKQDFGNGFIFSPSAA